MCMDIGVNTQTHAECSGQQYGGKRFATGKALVWEIRWLKVVILPVLIIHKVTIRREALLHSNLQRIYSKPFVNLFHFL